MASRSEPSDAASTGTTYAADQTFARGAYRFNDPSRFSLAHGGKDRHPYSVPLKVYDETICVLKLAGQSAKLGREEKLTALNRLDGSGAAARACGDRSVGGSGDRHDRIPMAAALVFGWEMPQVSRAGGRRDS